MASLRALRALESETFAAHAEWRATSTSLSLFLEVLHSPPQTLLRKSFVGWDSSNIYWTAEGHPSGNCSFSPQFNLISSPPNLSSSNMFSNFLCGLTESEGKRRRQFRGSKLCCLVRDLHHQHAQIALSTSSVYSQS